MARRRAKAKSKEADDLDLDGFDDFDEQEPDATPQSTQNRPEPPVAKPAAVVAKPSGDQVEERITGSIDRLVLCPGRADIIDYKSNRLTDDPAYRKALVEHYRPQLAAYREVVGDLFPGREIRTWLLFTDPEAGKSGKSSLTEVI